MSEQFLRSISLVVGTKSTNYDLSGMRIKFRTIGMIAGTLKRADILIYNLSDDTVNGIKTEFQTVTLSVGYGDSLGQIFTGEINRIGAGKENATDSFIHIWAQDGDKAKNFAVTNATLAAGWTDDDLLNQVITDFAPFGIGLAYKPALQLITGARGRSFWGKTEDLLSQLADRQGMDWFIEDGKLNLVPKNAVVPNGSVPILSPATGLVGVPQLDLEGIHARCLLNPNIKQGSQVQIAGTLINSLVQGTPQIGQVGDIIPQLQGQGLYKVMYVENSGDTRGNEWYTDMICVSTDTTGPASGPGLLGVPDAP